MSMEPTHDRTNTLYTIYSLIGCPTLCTRSCSDGRVVEGAATDCTLSLATAWPLYGLGM